MSAALDLFGADATPASSVVDPATIRASVERDRLDDDRPVVAVLTGRPKSPLWLHAGTCHTAHSRRHADRIDALMARAGFGPGSDAPTPDQGDRQS